MVRLFVPHSIWYKDVMRGAINPNWTHKIRLLALAAVLALGQFALAQHEIDIDKHVPGGHCEWCIAGSSLHAALGNQAWPPVTDLLRHVYAAQATYPVDLSFTTVYLSRAPPVFSRRSS